MWKYQPVHTTNRWHQNHNIPMGLMNGNPIQNRRIHKPITNPIPRQIHIQTLLDQLQNILICMPAKNKIPAKFYTLFSKNSPINKTISCVVSCGVFVAVAVRFLADFDVLQCTLGAPCKCYNNLKKSRFLASNATFTCVEGYFAPCFRNCLVGNHFAVA